MWSRSPATENQGPSLIASVGNNLWYQAGRWVRNDSGDGGWPIALSSSDPSGVCDMWAYVNGAVVQGPTATPNTAVWHQCPDQTWTQGAVVNTRDYVPGAGQLSLELDALNAAGVDSRVAETLNVDNDPVGVSLSTPNDPDTSQWVGHPVTVDAAASAGPSGIGGMNCSTDGAPAHAYPAGGVSVDGNGMHTVSCTAWNQAEAPSGRPATGTRSVTVPIDETPPNTTFEAQNPGDPTGLVVDTGDSESGVAGGQIEMRPATGGAWTALPTQFDGQHLLSRFDDAGLSGPYEFQAVACDNVGNCSATDQQLALPLRLASSSHVSFRKIVNPLQPRVVRQRVRVGWHWANVRRHGRLVRVKRGGHFKTIKVVKVVKHCTDQARPRRPSSLAAEARLQDPEAAPQENGPRPVWPQGHDPRAADHRTRRADRRGSRAGHGRARQSSSPPSPRPRLRPRAPDGSWKAILPPGPSRLIRAVYGGAVHDPAGERVCESDRARQGEAHQHHPEPAAVGQIDPDLRPGARRLHPREQQAASPGHRCRRAEQDPRDSGHRARRSIHRHIYVRFRPRGGAVLVHGFHARGGRFSIRALAFQAHHGHRRCPHTRDCGAPSSPRSPRSPGPSGSPAALAKAMIARDRGEHDSHWGRWRPSAGRHPAAASPRQIDAAARGALSPAVAMRLRRSARSRVRRVARWLVAFAAVAGAYVATSWGLAEFAGGPAQPRLPVTPRAWLDAYEAAAIDNPARRLLAAVRAAARRGLREGCARQVQALFPSDHELLGGGAAGAAGRRHRGARAAPDGSPPGLGGGLEPAGYGVAGGRPADG